MRYLSYIAYSVITIFLFQSCSLDEENNRYPTGDTYYKTEKGATELVNSAYTQLRSIYNASAWYLWELGTDIWQNGVPGSPSVFGTYEMQPSDSRLKGVWDACYLGIASCNALIDRTDVIEANQDVINDLKGQALFLRAYYYYLLITQWGDVPLQLNELKTPQTEFYRESAEKVLGQIYIDLEEAQHILPDEPTVFGRADKAAAQALLARVYLYGGEYAFAAEYAKKVIPSPLGTSTYKNKLLDDFAAIWDADNQNNDEVLFSVQYSTQTALNGSGNSANFLFLGRYDEYGKTWGMVRDIANGRPYRHLMPTRYLLNLLNESKDWDGRYDKSWTTVWYVNDLDKTTDNPGAAIGDTALFVPPYEVSAEQKAWAADKYRIYDIDDYFDANSPNGEETKGVREMYPSLRKFDDPRRASVNVTSTKDVIVLRMGEVYLIAAEALLMDNKGDEGVKFINELRKRAAKDNAAYEANKLSASDLTIDRILEERALELAGECVGRWTDLKRTGKLIERVKQYNPDTRNTLQDKHLLRPIPQDMMDRVSNKDTFKQNPEY